VTESSLRSEVAAWRAAGVAVPEIEPRLCDRGLDAEEVSRLVDATLAEQVAGAARRQRRRDRLLRLGGIGLCLLGVLLLVGGVLATNINLFALGAALFGGGVTLIIRALS
jgi:hypothetical protein